MPRTSTSPYGTPSTTTLLHTLLDSTTTRVPRFTTTIVYNSTTTVSTTTICSTLATVCNPLIVLNKSRSTTIVLVRLRLCSSSRCVVRGCVFFVVEESDAVVLFFATW